MTDKKENRGGARQGAGRPPGPKREFSEEFKEGILKALEKQAEETGKSMYDLFAERFYKKHIQDAVFASMFKIVADVMSEKKRVLEINDNRSAVVFLPEVRNVLQKPEAIEAEVVKSEDNDSSR